jgi:hypothetical protein
LDVYNKIDIIVIDRASLPRVGLLRTASSAYQHNYDQQKW